MAFRSVHSLRRWSFTFCTARATSIGGYLDILNVNFLSDFISNRHDPPRDRPVPHRPVWTSTSMPMSRSSWRPFSALS
jgi:hypothetical protein